MNPAYIAIDCWVLAAIVGGGEGAWFSGFLTACGIAAVYNGKAPL